MDKIPLEVFLNITNHLSYREKLELLSVNRHCYKMISTTNLFNSFKIKGEKNFNAAMDYFKNHNEYTSQVKNLCLIKPSAEISYILSMPSIFSYLEEFFWADYSNNDTETTVITKEIADAWQHLKYFQETNRHSLSKTILMSGGFVNLIQLKINFHFRNTDCVDLFEHLDMAPKLKHLELACVRLSLKKVDILHEKALELTTLHLADALQEILDFDRSYEEEQEELDRLEQENERSTQRHISSRKTKPAMGLRHLELKHMKMENRSSGLQRCWMTYIARKYTGLESLVIGGVAIKNAREPYYERKLVNILNACQNLKTYKVSIFPLTSAILDVIDKNQIKLKEIDISNNVELQLENLATSEQKHYIQHVRYGGDHIHNDNIMRCLEEFTNLTRLFIESNNIPKASVSYIPIDVIIRELNNLESLSLLSCEVGLSSNKEPTQSKLTSLILKRALVMDNDIMGFVSKSCPGLKKLTIQGRVENCESGGRFDVHFEDHYFSSIRVFIFGNEYYQVDDGNQSVCYKFKGRKFEKCDDIHKDQFYISVKYKGLTAINIGGVNIPKWCKE